MADEIQKAKLLLGIEEDIEISDLIEKVYNYRNSVHPDKYQKEFSDKFTSKFVKANEILRSLKRKAEMDVYDIEDKNELVLYSDKLRKHEAVFEIIELQEKISEFETKIESINRSIDENQMEREKILVIIFVRKKMS